MNLSTTGFPFSRPWWSGRPTAPLKGSCSKRGRLRRYVPFVPVIAGGWPAVPAGGAYVPTFVGGMYAPRVRRRGADTPKNGTPAPPAEDATRRPFHTRGGQHTHAVPFAVSWQQSALQHRPLQQTSSRAQQPPGQHWSSLQQVPPQLIFPSRSQHSQSAPPQGAEGAQPSLEQHTTPQHTCGSAQEKDPQQVSDELGIQPPAPSQHVPLGQQPPRQSSNPGLQTHFPF